jgi:hypothetical protein
MNGIARLRWVALAVLAVSVGIVRFRQAVELAGGWAVEADKPRAVFHAAGVGVGDDRDHYGQSGPVFDAGDGIFVQRVSPPRREGTDAIRRDRLINLGPGPPVPKVVEIRRLKPDAVPLARVGDMDDGCFRFLLPKVAAVSNVDQLPTPAIGTFGLK